MPQQLKRSTSLCSKQDRKRQFCASSYEILRNGPYVHKTRFTVYAQRVRRSLFASHEEYEQYLAPLAIRYYNVWKRTGSQAFPRRHDAAFVAEIAHKLQSGAVLNFRTIPAQQPVISLKATPDLDQPSVAVRTSLQIAGQIPSRAVSSSSRHVSSTMTDALPSRAATGLSRRFSTTSTISFASSHWPDRISRTRQSFEGSRWSQTLDSTTTSGFSHRATALSKDWLQQHGWEWPLPETTWLEREEVREQKGSEDQANIVLRRFIKTRIGRAPVPPGMLKALKDQRSPISMSGGEEYSALRSEEQGTTEPDYHSLDLYSAADPEARFQIPNEVAPPSGDSFVSSSLADICGHGTSLLDFCPISHRWGCPIALNTLPRFGPNRAPGIVDRRKRRLDPD